MASSRPIIAGEEYTPDDINNLRSDVLDPVSGHKHNGTDGARVPFSNLDVALTAGSGLPSGGTKSYNDLVNHVNANNGAHGIPSFGGVVTGYIATLSGGMFLQAGANSLSGYSKEIVFDVAFSSGLVIVVCCPTGSDAVIHPTGVSETGFTAVTDGPWSGESFNWMAFGKKS